MMDSTRKSCGNCFYQHTSSQEQPCFACAKTALKGTLAFLYWKPVPTEQIEPSHEEQELSDFDVLEWVCGIIAARTDFSCPHPHLTKLRAMRDAQCKKETAECLAELKEEFIPMDQTCDNCFYSELGNSEKPCSICLKNKNRPYSGDVIGNQWRAMKENCDNCFYANLSCEDEPCGHCTKRNHRSLGETYRDHWVAKENLVTQADHNTLNGLWAEKRKEARKENAKKERPCGSCKHGSSYEKGSICHMCDEYNDKWETNYSFSPEIQKAFKEGKDVWVRNETRDWLKLSSSLGSHTFNLYNIHKFQWSLEKPKETKKIKKWQVTYKLKGTEYYSLSIARYAELAEFIKAFGLDHLDFAFLCEGTEVEIEE